MQGDSCLNCGAAIRPRQKYCDQCGQETVIERITFPRLLRIFFQTFTHAEKGIFNLLKGLAIHPGKVAAEYADGKRKKYFNPFAFLAICIGLMALYNNSLNTYTDYSTPDQMALAKLPNERLKDLYVLTVKRNSDAQAFLKRNMNLMTVAVTPYFAFFLWLFFRGRGRNMAEINVAYILFTGFALLPVTILISPILAMTHNTIYYYILLYFELIVQTLYYAWGMKEFFGYKTIGGYFKVLGVLAVTGLVGFVIFFVAYVVYVYHGPAAEVLQYFSQPRR